MQCMYVCTYVCTYVCMYICMYVCTYVHMYICTYVCTYISNLPHSVRIQVGVGATPGPECGAQPKQTIYARRYKSLTGMIQQKTYSKFWRSLMDFNRWSGLHSWRMCGVPVEQKMSYRFFSFLKRFRLTNVAFCGIFFNFQKITFFF